MARFYKKTKFTCLVEIKPTKQEVSCTYIDTFAYFISEYHDKTFTYWGIYCHRDLKYDVRMAISHIHAQLQV